MLLGLSSFPCKFQPSSDVETLVFRNSFSDKGVMACHLLLWLRASGDQCGYVGKGEGLLLSYF